MRRFVVALLILGLTAPLVHGQAPDVLIGQYRCDGVGADGAAYRATVDIAAHGDAYTLTWHFQPDGAAIGVGVRHKDALAVIYQLDTGEIGLVAYLIEQASSGQLRLVGRWTVPGAPSMGTEVLVQITRRAAR